MPRKSRSSSGTVTGISPASRPPPGVVLALQGYRDREVEVGNPTVTNYSCRN